MMSDRFPGATRAVRLLTTLAAIVCVLTVCGEAFAQGNGGGGKGGGNAPPGIGIQLGRGKTAPNDYYFNIMSPYYDGDFRNALRGFRDAARSGIASTEGRWIDSICYYTMLGECYYQMGDLGNALDQYNAALELFLAHRD